MPKIKYTKKESKKTSISLSPYYQDIVAREMQTGKFNSITQLISYGLLLVEKESLLLKKAKTKIKK